MLKASAVSFVCENTLDNVTRCNDQTNICNLYRTPTILNAQDDISTNTSFEAAIADKECDIATMNDNTCVNAMGVCEMANVPDTQNSDWLIHDILDDKDERMFDGSDAINRNTINTVDYGRTLHECDDSDVDMNTTSANVGQVSRECDNDSTNKSFTFVYNEG
uniref:Uncharacterized protein n=1 Tax=Lygus hesperus TaxID=30085 RepID=A0A146LF80_LYGHE